MLDVFFLASVLSVMPEVREAERLLRGAESLARLATSVLQTLAQSSNLMAKPNDPCDVVMGDGNSNAAQTAKQIGRRRRRHKKSVQETKVTCRPQQWVLPP